VTAVLALPDWVRMVVCPRCGGNKTIKSDEDDNVIVICPNCSGAGEIVGPEG